LTCWLNNHVPTIKPAHENKYNTKTTQIYKNRAPHVKQKQQNIKKYWNQNPISWKHGQVEYWRSPISK